LTLGPFFGQEVESPSYPVDFELGFSRGRVFGTALYENILEDVVGVQHRRIAGVLSGPELVVTASEKKEIFVS
jgi:hypothetical protein